MTLNWSTNEIKTYTGQTFTTEKFDVSKIRKWVRLKTGIQDIVINQFLNEVIQEFCEKTWLLVKLIQVGDVLTETDNDSQYYQVTIDLTDYADGLLVHDINEITINNCRYNITKSAYLGDPTGDNETVVAGAGAYISPGTYIGPTTYLGSSTINKGAILDGYHYEIADDTTIKIWPVKLTDVILVPIVFKTSETATEIPYLLENYYKEIASGVIAEVRTMPRHQSEDAVYHASNYAKGISKGKFEYSRQYKGKIIRNNYFGL